MFLELKSSTIITTILTSQSFSWFRCNLYFFVFNCVYEVFRVNVWSRLLVSSHSWRFRNFVVLCRRCREMSLYEKHRISYTFTTLIGSNTQHCEILQPCWLLNKETKSKGDRNGQVLIKQTRGFCFVLENLRLISLHLFRQSLQTVGLSMSTCLPKCLFQCRPCTDTKRQNWGDINILRDSHFRQN